MASGYAGGHRTRWITRPCEAATLPSFLSSRHGLMPWCLRTSRTVSRPARFRIPPPNDLACQQSGRPARPTGWRLGTGKGNQPCLLGCGKQARCSGGYITKNGSLQAFVQVAPSDATHCGDACACLPCYVALQKPASEQLKNTGSSSLWTAYFTPCAATTLIALRLHVRDIPSRLWCQLFPCRG